MKHILAAMALCLLAIPAALAQDVYVPFDRDTYHLIDRYQIKLSTKVPELHTAVRPIGRRDVAALAEAASGEPRSNADMFNIQYLLNDNWNYTTQDNGNISERPIFNALYRNKTDLYHYESEDFTLRVNPVLHLELGLDNQSDSYRYVNTRGIQIEGSIDNRFGFYTFIGENQARFADYVVDRIRRDGVVPHEGLWKDFKTDGYDFLTARGYMNYSLSKHVEIQLGHDRHFIGDGYRSLVYSDYAPPAFFLKLNTRVWRLHYMNLFQELTADYRTRGGGDRLLPKKYMAMHRLGVNITDNINVGLFEQIIFGREKGKFELQYLNPIIFYRSVEHNLGSQDNALLGLDFRWNLFNTAQLYGQLVLDEFVINEVRSGDGWWANKQAGQIGAKYIDVLGLSNFDLQGEVNIIRPYMYQHRDGSSNYQHNRQPLAHPMGANLYEFVGIARYQPLPRLNLVGKAIATRFGQDEITEEGEIINWGNNVNYDYNLRPMNYGHEIAQGITTNQLHLDLTATYQFKHNLFVDLKGILRRTEADVSALSKNTTFTSVALRWNIAQRLHEF